MMRSLYSGVAGLKTHQTRMDVIGNNIANVNTTAFKSTAVSFQDIMYQTTSSASGATETAGGKNAKQIGLGVTTGATKISITSGGSAQSTGDALDIKLTDANSTNFFIVNNGKENLFTRAGSFYLDGNGSLAMTTTGYLVQGWQAVTNADGSRTIQRDTVSPLRIMSAENKTSEPEATEEANVTGVIDQTDSNINSESGRAFTLSFYDNLGYSYTARFTTKLLDESQGTYTVKLTNIYDSEQNDILDQWLNANIQDPSATEEVINNEKEMLLARVFGDPDSTKTDNYSIGSDFTMAGTSIVYKDYKADLSALTLDKGSDTEITFTNAANETTTKTIRDIFGVSGIPAYTKFGQTTDGNLPAGAANTEPPYVLWNPYNKTLSYTQRDTNCVLQFNTADGTFSNIKDVNTYEDGSIYKTVGNTTDTTPKLSDGGNSAVLKLEALRLIGQYATSGHETSTGGTTFKDGLRDINIDFSRTENYMNGGNSTVGADRGMVTDSTAKAGKALGALTGVSISQNGQIYGSYDNGNTVLLGQIAVAQFANASGLESLGDNCYGTTLNSGEFDGIGVDITSDGGSMSTGQLEMSNVDLATEFTDMITTQRGFQANSRIITVSDNMLEELTNLKR